MRYCKCTRNTLYISVRMTYIGVCHLRIYWHTMKVCVCLCECLCFLLLSFKMSLGCLFSLHHVNHGGFQTHPQVTLYKSHTAEESLRRHRACRHRQVLPDHVGQAWELLLELLPPHRRVSVVGQLCTHATRKRRLVLSPPK
jgi:hypothetical protein